MTVELTKEQKAKKKMKDLNVKGMTGVASIIEKSKELLADIEDLHEVRNELNLEGRKANVEPQAYNFHWQKKPLRDYAAAIQAAIEDLS